MLKQKLIPTVLIKPEERKPIVIDDKLPGTRFRLFYLAKQLFKLMLRLLWLKLTRRLEPKTIGIELRTFLQQMGVLWIKVGQLLSLRVDLLSPEISAELSKLQDRAPGFSPAQAKHFIEEDLGAPLEAHFSTFIEAPFAAASISQVHKAYLKHERVWVAVKVRKPGASETFSSDMAMIRWIGQLLLWLSISPHMRWQDMLWEIEQLMNEELDYHYEATNMRRMKKTLRSHKIYVPKVFTRYSTKRILVMEFLSGVLMSDYLKVARTEPDRLKTWLKENNVKPDLLGSQLFYSTMRQLFEDNLFHSDLHPGNLILLRNSLVAFIDFGSIGFSDQDFLKKYNLYLDALVSQQYAKVFDIYLLFPDNIPSIDLTHLKEEFIQILRLWQERCYIKALPYNEKTISALNEELLGVLGKYGLAMAWAFLRFMRVAATLDVTLRELIPEKNINSLLVKYFQRREQRTLRRLVQNRDVKWVDLPALVELPIKLNETMIFRGAIIRRLAQVFEGMTTKVVQWFDRLFGIIILILRLFSLFLLLVVSEQYQVAWLLSLVPSELAELAQGMPRLDIQVWVIIFIILLYSDRVLVKLRKRFREAEPKKGGL
jgi:ubiquinone biosynthesis protein